MEKIKGFVDNVFLALPKNSDTADLKKQVLTDMESKYSTLLAEGISENEALGKLFSEFGNASDYIAQVESVEVEELDLEDYYVPNKERNKATSLVGLGVALVAAGVLISTVMFNMLDSYVALLTGFPLLLPGIFMATKYSYDLRRDRHANLSASEKRRMRRDFESVYWLGVTTIYLVMGFALGLWHPGWMIFLIAPIFATWYERDLR